jgi:hypothetical protein
MPRPFAQRFALFFSLDVFTDSLAHNPVRTSLTRGRDLLHPLLELIINFYRCSRSHK